MPITQERMQALISEYSKSRAEYEELKLSISSIIYSTPGTGDKALEAIAAIQHLVSTCRPDYVLLEVERRHFQRFSAYNQRQRQYATSRRADSTQHRTQKGPASVISPSATSKNMELRERGIIKPGTDPFAEPEESA